MIRALRRPRLAAAADNLLARRRWHFCCVLFLLPFSMDDKKKVIRKENLEDRTKFFSGTFDTKFFPPPPTFWDRPPTKIGRHNDVSAGFYLCLNVFSIGQAARGSAKNI